MSLIVGLRSYIILKFHSVYYSRAVLCVCVVHIFVNDLCLLVMMLKKFELFVLFFQVIPNAKKAVLIREFIKRKKIFFYLAILELGNY